MQVREIVEVKNKNEICDSDRKPRRIVKAIGTGIKSSPEYGSYRPDEELVIVYYYDGKGLQYALREMLPHAWIQGGPTYEEGYLRDIRDNEHIFGSSDVVKIFDRNSKFLHKLIFEYAPYAKNGRGK